MIIKSVLSAIIVVLCGSSLFLLLAEPEFVLPQDRVVIPPLVRGTTYRVRVPIENHGHRLLKIVRLQTSCACTEASVDQQEISTGDRTWLNVTVAERSEGQTELLIHSNDPEQPVQTLTIAFTPTDPVRLQPAKFDFGRVDRDELPLKMSAVVDLYDHSWTPSEVMFSTDQTEGEFTVDSEVVSEGRIQLTVTLHRSAVSFRGGYVHVQHGKDGLSVPVLASIR